MKDKKLTTYQMAVTAVMAALLCVLGPLTVPIGAVPISLANFVICLTAWLLGPKFGTLSVVIYLALGAIGIPVFIFILYNSPVIVRLKTYRCRLYDYIFF